MADDRDVPVTDRIITGVLKERIYIKDKDGILQPYRQNIKFANSTITDDPENDTLIITILPPA